MPTVGVEAELLRDLLAQRDELVRSIAAGMHSGDWDPVMGPFDALLATIARLEDSLPGVSASEAVVKEKVDQRNLGTA